MTLYVERSPCVWKTLNVLWHMIWKAPHRKVNISYFISNLPCIRSRFVGLVLDCIVPTFEFINWKSRQSKRDVDISTLSEGVYYNFPSHITFILFVLLGKYSWVDVGRVVLTDPDHCCHFFQIPAPTSWTIPRRTITSILNVHWMHRLKPGYLS